MSQDKQTRRDSIRQELYTYLNDLHEESARLLDGRDPLDVYNNVQHLRSVIGQIDSAARRYRSAC